MRIVSILAIALLMVSIGHSQTTPVSAPNAAQSRIDALAGKLRANAVARVEIVQMALDTLTRTAMTPEMLEKSFDYKLVINLQSGGNGSGLAAALASTLVQPTEQRSDLRWGVIFFDAAGQRIAAVYLDKSGRRGAVDARDVSFDGSLGNWLKSNADFARVFR